MNAKQLVRDAEQRLLTETHKTLKEAGAAELHNAISGAAMDALAPLWKKKEEERFSRRQAYYLSMEFLVGRLVFNNLYCMGMLQEVRELLKEKGLMMGNEIGVGLSYKKADDILIEFDRETDIGAAFGLRLHFLDNHRHLSWF